MCSHPRNSSKMWNVCNGNSGLTSYLDSWTHLISPWDKAIGLRSFENVHYLRVTKSDVVENGGLDGEIYPWRYVRCGSLGRSYEGIEQKYSEQKHLQYLRCQVLCISVMHPKRQDCNRWIEFFSTGSYRLCRMRGNQRSLSCHWSQGRRRVERKKERVYIKARETGLMRCRRHGSNGHCWYVRVIVHIYRSSWLDAITFGLMHFALHDLCTTHVTLYSRLSKRHSFKPPDALSQLV